MAESTALEIVCLPAALRDVVTMAQLNARLKDRACSLDWSVVADATDDALLALFAGLSLDKHGDELGLDSISDSLSDRIASLLDKREARQQAALQVAPPRGNLAQGGRSPGESAVAPLPVASCSDTRSHLVDALEADFIGPFQRGPEGETEELPLAPSRWYLTGFLAPTTARESPSPADDESLAAGDDEDGEETSSEEPEAKPPKLLAASVGMSVLLPASGPRDFVRVRVSYADYKLVEGEPTEGNRAERGRERRKVLWRRVPQPAVEVELALAPQTFVRGEVLPDTRGLRIVGQIAEAHAPGLPKGTRALSLFLVNERIPSEQPGRRDEQFVFQVTLELRFERELLPRYDRRGEHSSDLDERLADLHYRHYAEYATGHGVSVEPIEEGGRIVGARTKWLPRATVPRIITHEVPSVTTSMDALAALENGTAAHAALTPLIEGYGRWLAEQRSAEGIDSPDRQATLKAVLVRAEEARERIASGIALLSRAPDVFEAFRRANAAMAAAARQRSPKRYREGQGPEWRLFQLAFMLLNLASIADERHPDRETVELIYFPTGGGKTEAYLGVIAFTLLLRRFRGQTRPDGGLGVAVLLRYTLRLLTLDQLSRAATLICALEVIRRSCPERLGDTRFSIGLWVGRSATANTLADVARRITEYKNSTGANAASPFPLTECPWCRTPIERDGMVLLPNKTTPREVVVACMNRGCDFSNTKTREGIPALFVDEPIYRELPSFLVATVDKFAMLPWRGETGALFGRVQARLGREFFGPVDTPLPKTAEPLPEGLRPPELIIQDELHLISGPLGTMVGLYETAIDALTTRASASGEVRPKIIASTATVRRAGQQARALFGRAELAVFPPPGVDHSETFFAKIDRESDGRLYVGVAATGRAMKALLLRSYLGLLGAAQRCYDPAGPSDQAADPYMTVAGYFNSLRELGGMRRLVEDDVRVRSAQNEDRRPSNFLGLHPWFANRQLRGEPVELTSRESTARIAEAKSRLARAYREEGRVDVLLASNMISVGVDIDRLGVMVVAGQPKTTAEYIQASSRVGRDPKRPGLVVTVFNLRKPRDRSHYERFAAYHASFYRFVEATSVTPFSAPALERGLAAVLVAMTRHGHPALTPAAGLVALSANRDIGNRTADAIAKRAKLAAEGLDAAAREALAATLRKRAMNLLDAWEQIVRARIEGGAAPRYSRLDRNSTGKPLLYTALDEEQPNPGDDEAKFQANTSLRDVEPSVHLWRTRGRLERKESNHGE